MACLSFLSASFGTTGTCSSRVYVYVYRRVCSFVVTDRTSHICMHYMWFYENHSLLVCLTTAVYAASKIGTCSELVILLPSVWCGQNYLERRPSCCIGRPVCLCDGVWVGGGGIFTSVWRSAVTAGLKHCCTGSATATEAAAEAEVEAAAAATRRPIPLL